MPTYKRSQDRISVTKSQRLDIIADMNVQYGDPRHCLRETIYKTASGVYLFCGVGGENTRWKDPDYKPSEHQLIDMRVIDVEEVEEYVSHLIMLDALTPQS